MPIKIAIHFSNKILKILFINWLNLAKMSEIYNRFYDNFAKF